jgi:hypothetical protein
VAGSRARPQSSSRSAGAGRGDPVEAWPPADWREIACAAATRSPPPRQLCDRLRRHFPVCVAGWSLRCSAGQPPADSQVYRTTAPTGATEATAGAATMSTKEVFDRLDADGSGVLDRQELRAAVVRNPHPSSPAARRLRLVLCACPTDEGGDDVAGRLRRGSWVSSLASTSRRRTCSATSSILTSMGTARSRSKSSSCSGQASRRRS